MNGGYTTPLHAHEKTRNLTSRIRHSEHAPQNARDARVHQAVAV